MPNLEIVDGKTAFITSCSFLNAQTFSQPPIADPLCRGQELRPICASVGQQRPGEASYFVGEHHYHHLKAPSRQQLREPRILIGLCMARCSMDADDEDDPMRRAAPQPPPIPQSWSGAREGPLQRLQGQSSSQCLPAALPARQAHRGVLAAWVVSATDLKCGA
jgi:hypothetical protein